MLNFSLGISGRLYGLYGRIRTGRVISILLALRVDFRRMDDGGLVRRM